MIDVVVGPAGTGKTREVADVRAVELLGVQGVPPEQVAIVSFTEAAAGEIRERVRSALNAAGHLEAARRLDASTLTTIHSLALSILREHAFDAGLPAEPLVLGELEARTLFAGAVARTLDEPGQQARLERLLASGLYPPVVYLGETSEQALRKDVFRVCEQARALLLDGTQVEQALADSRADLRAAFGPVGPAATLDAELAARAAGAQAFLATYPQGKTKGDRDVVDRLRRVCEAAVASPIALADLAEGVTKWSKAGKDLLAVAEPLTAAVEAWLRQHPASLAFVEACQEDLLRLAFGVLARYQDGKRRAGALDYEDMQAQAVELLERPVAGATVGDLVAARLRHLIVDEAQDTSPLQFALLQALRRRGTQVACVGDPNQGIYRFRGADSRLMSALLAVAGSYRHLRGNRRSRPELVRLTNEVFSRLLPPLGLPYVEVEPTGPYGVHDGPRPRVDLLVDAHRKGGPSLVGRVCELLGDASFEVWDRREQRSRPIRPGDVAILGDTNAELDRWAADLQAAGHRTIRELAGWSERLEVRLARAALTVLANPLASLELAALLTSEVYGLTELELQAAAELIRRPHRFLAADEAEAATIVAGITEQGRAALLRFRADHRALAVTVRSAPLTEVVASLLERLDLVTAFAATPEGPRARANLLRLVELAHAFAGLHERGLTLAGASGGSLENFLTWLQDVVAAEDDVQPDPDPDDDGAIHLCTVHGAKGLEWPVVVLPSLGRPAAPRLARIEIVRPADPEQVLAGTARLRVLPRVHGEALERDLAAALGGAQEHEAERARLLYVAITRAREHLVLPWRTDPADGSAQALLEQAGLTFDGARGALVLGAAVWPVAVCSSPAPAEQQTPWAADRDALGEALLAGHVLPGAGSVACFEPPPSAAPRVTSPTELCERLEPGAAAPMLRLSRLVRGPLARVRGDLDPTELGTHVHRALAVADLGFGGLDDAALAAALRPGLAHLPEAEALLEHVLAAVANTRDLVARLGAVEAVTEVPFLLPIGPHELSGTIDLALRAPDGWHVVDHKLHAIERSAIPRWATRHQLQLDVYARALEAHTRGVVVGRHLAFHRPGELATLLGPGLSLDGLRRLLDEPAAAPAGEELEP